MSIPFKVSHFALEDADRWGEELESLLCEAGLSVEAGSQLERMCLAPSEILGYKFGQGIASVEVYRQYLDAATLAELATRLLAARGHPSFETLLPHLSLLNQGDPRQAGVAQATDQAARKLFELFAALLAMRFSESVELEHPIHSSHNNPDVVVRYHERRWGLACKVPTSTNHESLIQNLDKAAKQVATADVDAGFALFNLKNVIPPEAYWRSDPDDPTGRGFLLLSSPAELMKMAISDVTDLWRGVSGHFGPEVFAKILSRPRLVPVVLSYFQALAPVTHESLIGATTSRFVACYHIEKHTEQDKELVDALHASATTEWA